MSHRFFVTAAKGIESLLRNELEALEISDLRETKGGVAFQGSLEQGYRICLWSRIASRVLLALDSFTCRSAENLYDGVARTEWALHFGPDSSFAVNFTGTSALIRNSHFGALKVKDAIVDQFRDAGLKRPSVDTEEPDLRIHVHLNQNIAEVYLDLSGDGLHKRGYRTQGGEAPLKENLAAAILVRAGWPEICARGGEFVDPMCGSATLLIEAAMIAGRIAPGLARNYFGFMGWKGHDPELWESLLADAARRKQDGAAHIPRMIGYDIDARALRIAAANIRNAGLESAIRLQHGAIDQVPVPPEDQIPGLIAVNPPYGERIGTKQDLEALYSKFGAVLKSRFIGWRVAMLVADPELGFRLGIRSLRPTTLYNGPIECKLLLFQVDPEHYFQPKETVSQDKLPSADSPLGQAKRLAETKQARAEMFANRLRKNLRNLGKWARREQISCYRVYDADLPEYALAIDLYRGSELWVHVQEYAAPSTIEPEKAETRLVEALSVIPEILDVPWQQVFFKVRRPQKGASQYTRLETLRNFHEIEESGIRLLVNFDSHLDTGLFLDHRITRNLIRQYAHGRSFLNLFGYTGTATVFAAAGGASSTVTVDLSKTYLEWAQKNLALNGLTSPDHRFVQSDVRAWLEQAVQRRGKDNRFDLIFLDPPTFSNSKNIQDVFELQRDHVALIERALELLALNGLLIFSTNSRKLRIEAQRLTGVKLRDISPKTIPKDFERNPTIHRCWEIRRIEDEMPVSQSQPDSKRSQKPCKRAFTSS